MRGFYRYCRCRLLTATAVTTAVLSQQEVGFLKSRDAGKGRIDFVDIAAPSYSPADNAGITYEQVCGWIRCGLQLCSAVMTEAQRACMGAWGL